MFKASGLHLHNLSDHFSDSSALKIASNSNTLRIKPHHYYRSSGVSFTETQREFSKGVVSNKNVQKAALDTMKSSKAETSDTCIYSSLINLFI